MHYMKTSKKVDRGWMGNDDDLLFHNYILACQEFWYILVT